LIYQEKGKEKKNESQDTDLDKAATKIQAGYRGYRVRKGDIKPKVYFTKDIYYYRNTQSNRINQFNHCH
jgi:hypothetical protein